MIRLRNGEIETSSDHHITACDWLHMVASKSEFFKKKTTLYCFQIIIAEQSLSTFGKHVSA